MIIDQPASLSAAAASVFSDADCSTIQLRVVQLRHRILHVAEGSKLRNPVNRPSQQTAFTCRRGRLPTE